MKVVLIGRDGRRHVLDDLSQALVLGDTGEPVSLSFETSPNIILTGHLAEPGWGDFVQNAGVKPAINVNVIKEI